MPTNYLLGKPISYTKNEKYKIESIKIKRDAAPVPSIDGWKAYKPSNIVGWHIKFKVGF